MKKSTKAILALILASVILVAAYLLLMQNPQPVACTADALICPDGSAVGRIPPGCRFAPCPNCTCPEAYIPEGSACTPKCYYSTPSCLMPSIECNYTETVK